VLFPGATVKGPRARLKKHLMAAVESPSSSQSRVALYRNDVIIV